MNAKTFAKGILIATSLGVSLSAQNDVSVSGFVSNGYIESSHYNYLVDSEEGSFEFAEIGVNANWSPVERTVVTGQLFAFELGEYGNFDPLIDYLFVDYNVNPAFGIRAGRVKKPNGIYNEIQDIDIARTSVLLPIGMYDQRYRDFGASVDGLSLYGTIDLGSNNSIDYNAYHGKIDLSEDGGIGAFAATAMSRSLPGARVEELSGDANSGIQLWWNTAVSGLRTGLAYSVTPDVYLETHANMPAIYPPAPFLAGAPIVSAVDVEVSNLRYSLEYFVNAWTFTSEYEVGTTDTVEVRSIAGMANPADSGSSKSEAYYVSASRRFLEKFEAGLTYAAYFGNRNNKTSPTGHNKDWQFSLRYDATPRWTLKAEIHSIQGTSRLFNQLNQNPIIDQENWTLFAAKSSFMF